MGQVRFLLDTNVLIGLLKDNPECTALLQQVKTDLSDCAISQITRMELLGFAGLSADDEKVIQNLLNNLEVILLTEGIEAKTIGLRRARKIKLPDAMIAATALVSGLELVTLDIPLIKIIQEVLIEKTLA